MADSAVGEFHIIQVMWDKNDTASFWFNTQCTNKMGKVTRVIAFVAANLKSESSHPSQNRALSKDTVHICDMMAIKI